MNYFKLFTMLLFTWLGVNSVSAQNCTFTVDNNVTCVKGQVSFTPKVTGISTITGYRWEFGDGNGNNQASPLYQYLAAGTYKPKLVVYYNNALGQKDSCISDNTAPIITVFNGPKANFVIAPFNNDTQCYEGNNFCFADRSKADPSTQAKIIRRIVLWDDGSKDSTGNPQSDSIFCHSYNTNTNTRYGVKIIVTDTNGCISEYIDSVMVYGKIEPRFTTSFTLKCDSTDVLFTTSANINLNEVEQFWWDFGDGTGFTSSNPPTTSEKIKNWTNFVHWYKKAGPFAAKLRVKSKFGCIDSFTLSYAGDNVSLDLKPVIVNDDTQCWAGHELEFRQTPLFIPQPGKQQVYWIWNHPPPNNIDSGTWNPTHVFPGCGAKKVTLIVWQPPCMRIDTTVDSIMLYGPTAKIENPPMVMIADSERHQCDVKNAVHFTNVSQICNVDTAWWYWDFDDASNDNSIKDTGWADGIDLTDTLIERYDGLGGWYKLIDRKKKRVWESGPFLYYVRVSATAVKNNSDPTKYDTIVVQKAVYGTSPIKLFRKNYDSTLVNGTWVYKAKNTHFSYDWKPVHYYDSVEARERCHTPKLMMWGVWKKWDKIQEKVVFETCYSENQVPFALMNPSATGLRVQGQQCLGPMPPYGITFNWSKSKPGCTQQFVSINFDSACCSSPSDPKCWTPQSAFAIPPWSPFPPFPTQYKRPYFFTCDPTNQGWVTVGLAIHNRRNDSDNSIQFGRPKMCSDTVWYHRILRFVDNFPPFKLGYKNTVYACPKSYVEFSPNDTTQDSIISVTWNWGDGSYTVDSIRRRPVYQRTRYDYAPNGVLTTTDLSSTVGDTVVGKMYHYYERRGIYRVSLNLVNTDTCENAARGRVMVGNFAEMYAWPDTVVCKGQSEITFTPDVHYWDPIGPPISDYEWDTTSYWKDPTLGGTRKMPTSPGGYEFFFWHFGDKINPTATDYEAKHKFSDTGLYTVRFIFRDSMDCKDTMSMQVMVQSTKAGFTIGKKKLYCNEVVQFFDTSVIYGPCNRTPGCLDNIVYWEWDFGDKKTKSYLQNPFHQYTSNGKFTVTLIVRSKVGCPDTIRQEVEILGPKPKIRITSDTIGCAPLTVKFKNESDAASKNFQYRFGDGGVVSTDKDTDVVHTYTQPGIYYVFLEGNGSVYDSLSGTTRTCVNTYPDTPLHEPIIIRVLPTPEPGFTGPLYACVNTRVTFKSTADTTYKNLIWDFGDGVSDSILAPKDSVTHVYTKEDTFYVHFRPRYTPPPGYPECRRDSVRMIIITDVKADFDIDTTIDPPLFKFKNKSSLSASDYWWDFGDPASSSNTSSTKDAEHDYENRRGKFTVCLVVRSAQGCLDTICKVVENNYEIDVRIPNYFSPDADNTSDEYFCEVKGRAKAEEGNYRLFIYNRWGEMVFKTDSADIGWNGKVFNTGGECPDGTYFFVFQYKVRAAHEPLKDKNFAEQTEVTALKDDKTHWEARGTITLMRKH